MNVEYELVQVCSSFFRLRQMRRKETKSLDAHWNLYMNDMENRLLSPSTLPIFLDETKRKEKNRSDVCSIQWSIEHWWKSKENLKKVKSDSIDLSLIFFAISMHIFKTLEKQMLVLNWKSFPLVSNQGYFNLFTKAFRSFSSSLHWFSIHWKIFDLAMEMILRTNASESNEYCLWLMKKSTNALLKIWTWIMSTNWERRNYTNREKDLYRSGSIL